MSRVDQESFYSPEPLKDPINLVPPTETSEEVLPLEISEVDAKHTLMAALELQHQQNTDDKEWLKALPLSTELRAKIYSKLVQRGGRWLEFVRELVGYEGDFGELTKPQSHTPTENS